MYQDDYHCIFRNGKNEMSYSRKMIKYPVYSKLGPNASFSLLVVSLTNYITSLHHRLLINNIRLLTLPHIVLISIM